ncbi:MAG: serine/threonine protein kinase [Planctomycetaceae bacterium]|nr:serine/threonine protein kinase [Planctomycetaceae bacterium]
MSTVMLAYDRKRERRVALKIPHAQPVDQMEMFEKRFLREAKAALAVKHPNLCRLFHVGVDSGTFFLVMDYIEGAMVYDLLETSGPLSEKDAAKIIMQVASGVAKLHRQGILHRDLKPENIMIKADGTPVVLDFGLAKFFEGEGAWDDLTETSQRIGTPAYMAPEQILGENVTPLSDQFSLGAVFWLLLCDREPFEGTPLKVMDEILAGDYASPRDLRPGLSIEIERLCLRLMSHDPQDRFESMDTLAAEFQLFLDAPSKLRV